MSAKAVAFEVNGNRILGDVSFDVPAGASVAVLGRSGVGKTTILRLIAGIEVVSGGSLLVGGVVPSTLHQHRKIGFLFQEPALWPHRSVRETLRTTYHLHDREADEARIAEVLREVGLDDAIDRYPHELSTGMRARLAVGRIFCVPPGLLLMDEPFAAIDALRRPQLNMMVHRLRERTGCTVIWTTHDVVEAMRFATKLVILGGAPAQMEAELVIDDSTTVVDPASLSSQALLLRDRVLALIDGGAA